MTVKLTKIFGGTAFDRDQTIDPEIIWMWQKVCAADSVVRVVATTLGDVTISDDRPDKTLYSAIYLDGDIIDAINYAKGLVDGLVRWESVGPSVDNLQEADGGGA